MVDNPGVRCMYKQRQRGVTFLGLLVVGVVLAAVGVVVAQVVPTFIEYQGIQKAANKAAQGTTVVEVRTLFQKAVDVDYITSMQAKDLDISKEGDKVVVAFAYQREIHLAGPAYLVLKYSGRSQ